MTDRRRTTRPARAAVPRPGEERFFALFEIDEARLWALAGGIALHRNFDLDGVLVGGRRRYGPAFHMFGQRQVLLEWGRKHRLNPGWLQPPDHHFPPHFDVFGALAQRLVRRAPGADGGHELDHLPEPKRP